MKTLKLFILLVLVALCNTEINAQSIRIYKKDKSVITVSYLELDSIVGIGYSEYDFVDLGLSVKWAKCNLGAENPEDYGNYYAWGEIEPKESYTEENSLYYGKKIDDISGKTQYDAATANLGAPARLPKQEDFKELIDKCEWKWTTLGNVNGMLVTGPNGNTIFLPAAGYRYDTWLRTAGEYGLYWGSAPNKVNDVSAYGFYINDHGGYGYDWYYRYYGRSVRPVSD